MKKAEREQKRNFVYDYVTKEKKNGSTDTLASHRFSGSTKGMNQTTIGFGNIRGQMTSKSETMKNRSFDVNGQGRGRIDNMDSAYAKRTGSQASRQPIGHDVATAHALSFVN